MEEYILSQTFEEGDEICHFFSYRTLAEAMIAIDEKRNLKAQRKKEKTFKKI